MVMISSATPSANSSLPGERLRKGSTATERTGSAGAGQKRLPTSTAAATASIIISAARPRRLRDHRGAPEAVAAGEGPVSTSIARRCPPEPPSRHEKYRRPMPAAAWRTRETARLIASSPTIVPDQQLSNKASRDTTSPRARSNGDEHLHRPRLQYLLAPVIMGEAAPRRLDQERAKSDGRFVAQPDTAAASRRRLR
jgi:hypothetical protein